MQSWVRKVVKDVEKDPTAGVRNVNASGAVAQVVTAAKDGVTVTNADAVAAAAVAALQSGKDYTGTLEQRPRPRRGPSTRSRPAPSGSPTTRPTARSGSTSTCAPTR